MSPRWQKVLSDLRSNKGRSALIVLSIAIGVIAVGLIEGARQILQNNLVASYEAAHPATITFDISPFKDSLLPVVRRLPGVRAARGQGVVGVRVLSPNGAWRDMLLFASDDMTASSVNNLLPVGGTVPPPPHQIALERSALSFIGAQVGDSLVIELPDGGQEHVVIGGVVHDLSQAPSALTGAVSGYTTLDTFTWLGLPSDLTRLNVLTDDPTDRATIVNVAESIHKELQARGFTVLSTTIPAVPGRLYFADSVQSMMILLTTLGIASLLSSAILVITTMSALLARQVREIGVMKSIGASTAALLGMYLTTVLIYGLIAILIAIPLGAIGAYLLVLFSTDILNLLPVSFEIVPGAIALQAGAGVLIPVLAALVPVISGTRISVRQAITSYGLGGGDFGNGWLDRLVEYFRTLPRPMLLSLRNAFRRKGRLALTIATLVISGGVFIGVLTARESLIQTFSEIYAFRNYDLQMTLAIPQRVSRIEREALQVTGVKGVEAWGLSRADLRRAENPLGDAVSVYGVHPNSNLLKVTIFDGRWLDPADGNALVLNAEALKNDPSLRVGDRVTLSVNGHDTSWQIVGIARSVLRGPLAYVPYSAWTRSLDEDAFATTVQVVANANDPASQARLARALEEQFKRADMPLSSIQTSDELRVSDESNMNSIIGFVSAMAILLAFVGGMGLMGTMGINVLERTREIGVLRAIGAPTPSLVQIVIVEGVLIGLMSFPFAILLSIPFGIYLSNVVGFELLQTQLTYTFSYFGVWFWLALLIFIAAVSSLIPAWSAIRITVRSALAFE